MGASQRKIGRILSCNMLQLHTPEVGVSSSSSTESNPEPKASQRILPSWCRRLEGSRILNSFPIIVAACPFGPSHRGSSIVLMLLSNIVRGHKEVAKPLHNIFSPCLDVKIPLCRWLFVAPSRRLGRRVGTILVRCSATPRSAHDDLPSVWQRFPVVVREHTSFSISFNLPKSEPVRPGGVKDTCDGGGGPTSPLIGLPPPARSPLFKSLHIYLSDQRLRPFDVLKRIHLKVYKLKHQRGCSFLFVCNCD